jgi:hypothetical protein
MEHNKKDTRKMHLLKHSPSVLINTEKVKNPELVAHVFNDFFLTVGENLNLHQS